MVNTIGQRMITVTPCTMRYDADTLSAQKRHLVAEKGIVPRQLSIYA